jgi:hypothetical protein
MHHFLITFNRRTAVVDVEEFDDATEALQARFAAERRKHLSSDIEIVVLNAPSREALKATHSRYFVLEATAVTS